MGQQRQLCLFRTKAWMDAALGNVPSPQYYTISWPSLLNKIGNLNLSQPEHIKVTENVLKRNVQFSNSDTDVGGFYLAIFSFEPIFPIFLLNQCS